MMKKFYIAIIMIILIISLCCRVSLAAEEVHKTTSTINDVEVQWEYYLNEAGQITDLVCKNPGDLRGNITIPTTLDGKQVVSLGYQAFKNANSITGVTLQSNIKYLDGYTFSGCENLESVNLGTLERISSQIFENCPKLKSVKIPKTLTSGPSTGFNGPFSGTTRLTSVTFEDGITIIPAGILRGCKDIKSVTIPNSVTRIDSYAFASSGLTEISIHSNVKSIEADAFANCEDLENVNLGRIETLGIEVFANCPKLEKITIPNTLVGTNYLTGVFTGSTKLSSVTIEEGMLRIPGGLFKKCKYLQTIKIPDSVVGIDQEAFCGSGLTEITIPSNVKDLSYEVFSDCENLEKVDLGKIESVSFRTFNNCPKLKSITIPKTLKGGPNYLDEGVFTGTTKLTSVVFEDGITVIPDEILLGCSEITSVIIPNSVTGIGMSAFKGTGISEIDIPSNVKGIGANAFEDCTNLKKITILDNCTDIGNFYLYPNKDTVFQNHSEDLTIYCYEGSVIANYAINNNINYVYLTKPAGGEGSGEQPGQNQQTPGTNPGSGSGQTQGGGQSGNGQQSGGQQTGGTKDPTTAQGTIPQTGENVLIVASIIVMLGLSIVLYKLKKKNEIK